MMRELKKTKSKEMPPSDDDAMFLPSDSSEEEAAAENVLKKPPLPIVRSPSLTVREVRRERRREGPAAGEVKTQRARQKWIEFLHAV